MKTSVFSVFVLVALVAFAAPVREAKVLRHPDYHDGRVAFSYLGDIWTADESGANVQRLTVHVARDAYPRFSPDGRWIAFSSARDGNMDVFIIPSEGGAAKQLTFHSSDDMVLGWSPDGSSVLFSSNRRESFANKLYSVSVDGGMPVDVGADMGYYAGYSPDGAKLAINRKRQAYWRKGYRGANQSDVMVMDIAAGRFTKLTDFSGMDRWPMWSPDGHIYFVSDRGDAGIANIWRIPEAGGEAEPVTSFTEGEVRWPGISVDGRVIVFERDFGIWKLDVASRQTSAVSLRIAAETQESLTEMRDFRSEADDYDLAPSGARIVLSIHGEVFTAPTDEGDVAQITSSPWRDTEPQYSPDGEWIAFISDASGREEIWIAPASGEGEARMVTDVDALKSSFAWSPDSREIAFTSSDYVLRKVDVGSRRATELASCEWGSPQSPAWSPDGNWIAFTRPNHMRTRDVYLVLADGGEERQVTFDAYSDFAPVFSADGRKLYFIRTDRLEASLDNQPAADIYAVTLVREERDPDEPQVEESEREESQAGPRSRGRGAREPEEIVIDWAGLERRTRQVTEMAFPVVSFAVSPDDERIAFVSRERRGPRSVPVIYSIKPDGEGLTTIHTGRGAGPGFGFFGQRSGIASLNFAPNGRTLLFREGNNVYSVSVGAAGPAGPPTGRGGLAKRIEFTARVKIDRPAEWAQMFDDAWRALRHRFYDPAMHGTDWEAIHARYRPLVAQIGTREDLIDHLNEMIGELNASHNGARPSAEGDGRGVSTDHLGLQLEPDDEAGRYRVVHVYKDGPADKDWVRVSEGDYLIAIDGEEVKSGDNFWPLLNHHLNEKVEVSFAARTSGEDAWKTRIEPISIREFGQLRYERWVAERAETVEDLSDGRIGYLHIQAMNQPSLQKFEKELRANRDKEALIIDQRWNGGGNIEQQLLTILRQQEYQIWVPRGTKPSYRPAGGFFGPEVVLQNWRSGSNAEMFPAGFRALGLGKVIGTPTAGAVIGTGSYRLIDGSTVRMPGVGVYLADSERTNMENYGVQPDIYVENAPEDNLAGRDRVIEVAVQELLKELEESSGEVTTSRK